MKILRRWVMLGLVIAALPVHAQNAIADLGGSTTREKNVFAVYDLRGANIDSAAIEKIVLDSIRLHARDAQVREGIVPQPYPDSPGQMTIGQRSNGGPKPECAGEVFSIEGIDSALSKYGEKTYHRACLFPYAGGYRINYYAIYVQQSGAGNANPNVLAAMLGRAMGSIVGVGDSSTAINKVLENLESGLQGAGIGFKLVQLQPKDLPGRTVVADDLTRPVAQTPTPPAPLPNVAPAAIQPIPAQFAMVASPPPAQQNLPPELAQLQAAMMQQREAVRQQMAAQQAAAPGQSGKKLPAMEARKELTAMGLQYFSQEQFVAAVSRGDSIAVDLFITGDGVDLTAGAPGATPLAIAERNGKQDIVALLKSHGAH
jgi:hypothetical protein